MICLWLLSLVSVRSSLANSINKGGDSYDYRNSVKPWEDKCTTMAIGKTATIDGSTVCTDTMVRIFIAINHFDSVHLIILEGLLGM
jgi:hypothetical protein